jgi:hypothetical protein
METKPIWTSKTLWTNAVAVVAAMSGVFGMDLGLDGATQAQLVIVIMGIVNIALRFVTTKGIK